MTGDTSLGCLDAEALIEGELTTGAVFPAADTDLIQTVRPLVIEQLA